MVSVVIPIYNSEKTLKKCLDSLLIQTYINFELLLIDDGSTDSSGLICDQYKAKDPRVRVFHKKNGGVASARNLGIKCAQGDWITFCDSDDWADNNWLEVFVTNITDVQLVVQSFNIVGDTDASNKEESYEGDVCHGVKMLYQSFMPGSLWNKMIRSDVIKQNDILFDEQLSFREDEEFLLRLYPHVRRVRKLTEATYNYVVPQYDKKYRDGIFYQFIKIYKTMSDDFYEGFTNVKEVYVKDLTYSLLDSYQKHEKDRYEKLVLYKRYVGKDVVGNINIAKYMQYLLTLNIHSAHLVLLCLSDIKGLVKRV